MPKIKPFAKAHPELLDEWNWEKNKEIVDPYGTGCTSTIKVWWRCKTCGYEWYATINNRHIGRGCPYCSGKALWTGRNDLETTNPELASEWDYEKNKALLPSMFMAGSQKKVWWRCNICGHRWFASIGSRKQGNGCPECSKLKIGASHTLAVLNPQLASEWNYDNNDFSPSEITANTNYKAWWTCPDCGYVYCSAIANRHKKGTGCPVCSNQILCTGINDLQTLHPDIASEWSEENELSPDKVIAGGHTKYFFRCKHCGFTWRASLAARIKGTGCPKCSSSLHTSIPEQVIYQCLKRSLPSTKNSYKPKWLNGREIDIYLPRIKVGIEYDGGGWHQSVGKDIEKTRVMMSHGVTLIRIRDPKCPIIDDESIQIVTSKPKSDQQYLKNAIIELFAILNKRFNLDIELLCDVNDVYSEELRKYRNKELEYSFASEYPDLLDEWDELKNNGLDPHRIPPRSNVRIWWQCKTCGYEWMASVDRRATGAGCPYCAHEVVWSGHNDVETLRPDLLAEWDYENNHISPQEITPNSHQRIAWKCCKCGHRWRSPIYNKSTGHGCPKCARKAVADKQSKRVVNLDTGTIYKSAKAASDDTGIAHSNITRVCRGEGKKAGGFHWAYIDEDTIVNPKKGNQ